ncbi:cytochrome c biogenesis protein ResB [Kineococcus rubinsiae]|uniref:cytochrome c biogenesis protein ResB n=1 Tax=Kineococcus rubinsiae TaxID=2609562 RepID=UPI001FCC9159|nr:cytochrome c biogenesis protein ResB [Kineococcus rubinsiae]
MRTALLLLMLLAVAAVPGSMFPQSNFDAAGVAQYLQDNPRSGPWLQRLQVFEVYSSVWFSAIYLLLFISLIGCIAPRTAAHARAVRARPPRTPTRLSRLPEFRTIEVTEDASAISAAAAAHLRGRGFRVDLHPEVEGATSSVAAERGHHRETGNVVFHLALIGLLVSFAISAFYSYSGQRLVTVGEAFVGAAGDFDSFSAGAGTSSDQVPPFTLTLDNMDVAFEAQQEAAMGEPRQFAADVRIDTGDTGQARKERIEVNSPATIQGMQVSLSGNGYAPVITVRDGTGEVVQEGAVPFLPQTGNYDSTGVVKVPDAIDAAGNPRQMALQGVFLPSATINAAGQPVSGFPGLGNPFLVLSVYTGDLGLDSGVPQNVYELDTTAMSPMLSADGTPLPLQLTPGQSVDLPNGLGSVTFEEVTRFAAFDIRYTPGQTAALTFALLATGGLTASLFIPRRRVWVRVTQLESETTARVDIGGLARGSDAGLGDELDRVVKTLTRDGGGGALLPDPSVTREPCGDGRG